MKPLIVAAIITACFILPTRAYSDVEFHLPTKGDDLCYVKLYGTIKDTDAERMKSESEKVMHADGCSYFYAQLDSMGGDILAAMEIGRQFRKLKIDTRVGSSNKEQYCASACALALLGGVRRYVDIFSGHLGIHRAYFEQLPQNITSADVRRARDHIRAAISDYLREMDVSQLILAEMDSVPPGKMKWLSQDEMGHLGFIGEDPSHEEMRIAEEARKFGLTSAEYRRRGMLADEFCSKRAWAMYPQASQFEKKSMLAYVVETKFCQLAFRMGYRANEYSRIRRESIKVCDWREDITMLRCQERLISKFSRSK